MVLRIIFLTPHSTYSMENLNDGDPDTINQVEYHSPTGEDMYENLLLKDPFYIILDLKKAYDLESIEINWYPKGGRCYKYIVSGSLDDKTYVEIANHADNVTEPNAIKDTFKGLLQDLFVLRFWVTTGPPMERIQSTSRLVR